jgi:hypothetical protein
MAALQTQLQLLRAARLTAGEDDKFITAQARENNCLDSICQRSAVERKSSSPDEAVLVLDGLE